MMSYDLNDGYDRVAASWCVDVLGDTTDEKGQPNHFASRDPTVAEYQKLDCSIRKQNLAFVQQFNQNIICPTNAVVPNSAPKLIFGIEIGFPNFPINLDPSLPGGGTNKADTTIAQYRYNDPWAVLDVPLKADAAAADVALIEQWRLAHQKSFAHPTAADV